MASLGKINEISEAIQILKPGAKWNLRGDEYSGLEWPEQAQSKPTEQELIDKIASRDYVGKRKLEYPPVDEQVEALMEGGQKLADIKADIAAIKAEYPKPV